MIGGFSRGLQQRPRRYGIAGEDRRALALDLPHTAHLPCNAEGRFFRPLRTDDCGRENQYQQTQPRNGAAGAIRSLARG